MAHFLKKPLAYALYIPSLWFGRILTSQVGGQPDSDTFLIYSGICKDTEWSHGSLPMNSCPFPFSCRSFPGEDPVKMWPLSTFKEAVCSVL